MNYVSKSQWIFLFDPAILLQGIYLTEMFLLWKRHRLFIMARFEQHKIRSILTINERLAKLWNIYTKGIYAAIKKRKSQCSLCADMEKSAGIFLREKKQWAKCFIC